MAAALSDGDTRAGRGSAPSFSVKGRSMKSELAHMTLEWSAPPGELRTITSALQGLMAAARAEPGCAGCSLSTRMGSRVVIQYVEDWKSEDDLKRQLRSERFGALAELMERAIEQPTVEFALNCGAIYGLEYAEAVRQSVEL
jgi:quinol monooxygenase YgiN